MEQVQRKIWFTSDLHFYHKNIIKYSDRPFDNIYHMNDVLVDNWNSVIGVNDLVYYLGDFAFCSKKWATEMCSKLNGEKILIKGNHDGSTQRMLDIGFKEVYNKLELNIAGEKVLLCHYPYKGVEAEEREQHVGEENREEKLRNKRPDDNGEWLLHGHIHNYWKFKGRMINMSTEMWNYTPVSLKTIENIIKEGPKYDSQQTTT